MTAAGYHHAEEVMGTVVSIDVRDPVAGRPGLDEVLRWLHRVDRTFSTYRDDSAVTRLARGEVGLADVDPDVREILAACDGLREATGGAFDARAVPAPNGTHLDPSGLVKGWSIERAARLLEDAGLTSFCLNAGGDVAVRGSARPGAGWRVGVRDPWDPAGLAAVLELSGPAAVATSATYERGAHIVDPRTGAPAHGVASATVVGPDLGLADAYATALCVMGPAGVAWVEPQPGYEALLLTEDGRELHSSGFDRWRVDAGAHRSA